MELNEKKPRKRIKTKYNYEEIITKYQTGQYSFGQLSKMYGISKSTLSEYIKKHEIEKSEHAPNAINHLSLGFSELAKINGENKPNEQISLIVEETLNIVKSKNPIFAKTLQALSSQLLNKAFAMLEKSTTTKELNDISNVMQKVNDTLQVIPKAPLIALQNNIQNNQLNAKGSLDSDKKDDFNINIEFVESKQKKEKENEIIDIEVKD